MGIVVSVRESRPTDPLITVAVIGFCALIVASLGANLLPVVPAVIGVALFVAFTARFPQAALIFVLACTILLPVDLALKVSGLPRVGPTRILIAAFLVGYLFRKKSGPAAEKSTHRNPLLLPIAAFLLLAFVGSLLSIDAGKSIFSLVSFVFEEFVFFFILCSFLRKPNFWKTLKRWLFLVTCLVCVLAIIEEFTHFNPFIALYPQEEMLFRGSLLRVRSTFFHPIALGCYLTLIAPFALVELIESKRKILYAVVMALIGVTLFLTVSRGPWVGFLIEAAGLLFWYLKKNRTAAASLGLSALLIIGLIAGTYFLMDPSSHSFDQFLNPSGISVDNINEKSSEYYRIALFKAVLNQMSGYRALIGYGPGTFHLANVESKYAGDEHTLTAADSYYLKVLFEHGGLGLAAFLAILAVAAFMGWKAVQATPSNKALAVAALVTVIAFAFENITVSMFSLLPLELMFFLAIAISFNLGKAPVRHGLS